MGKDLRGNPLIMDPTSRPPVANPLALACLPPFQPTLKAATASEDQRNAPVNGTVRRNRTAIELIYGRVPSFQVFASRLAI